MIDPPGSPKPPVMRLGAAQPVRLDPLAAMVEELRRVLRAGPGFRRLILDPMISTDEARKRFERDADIFRVVSQHPGPVKFEL